jgi:hypothetical protein
MSQRTALCLVNVSGKIIKSMSVKDVQGFENDGDFAGYLPDQALPDNAAHCGYLEIDGKATYTLTVNFGDGTSLSYDGNQSQALVKHAGIIPHKGDAKNVEVYRTSGGDVDGKSHGTTGIYFRAPTAPDNSGWMGKLLQARPTLSLSEIVLPGSHDAGLYEVSYPFDVSTQNHPEWVTTQALRVGGQLRAGARYFDLRIRADKGTLCAAHWSDVGKTYGALGAPLNDILNDVVDFLQGKGHGEVVVLKFSHAADAAVAEKAVKRVKDIVGGAKLLYNPAGAAINLATAPLLKTTAKSEMAGKVVAVFGGDGTAFDKFCDPAEGIFSYHDMPLDNASNANVEIPRSRLYVYDHYSNDGTYSKMLADQTPKLAKYGGLGKKYLFLLSWTLSGGGVVSDIEVLAGIANPWLPKLLSETKHSDLPNIAFLDWIDPYICGTVIAANN